MIEYVATLNNNGAQHIINQNYDEAIRCLLRCMKVTKQMLNQMEMNMASRTKRPSSCCRDTTSASNDFAYEFLHANDSSCCMSSAETSFVFKQAVVVTNCTSSSSSNDDDVVMSVLVNLAVISVYNLALAHHLSGLERQCRQRLERARNYYELSHKLQAQESTGNFILLHSLSVLNNVGAICCVLDDREASEKFFSKLLTALTYLRENGDAGQVQNSWNGFWSNAVTSILCKPTAAGAA